MNIKAISTFLIGGACMIAGFVINYDMSKNYKKEINTGLDRSVYEKYGHRSIDAKTALDIAKADAQKVYNKEIAATKSVVEANPEYMAAKTTIDSNYEQINVLKKSLEAAKKGDTTSVAVANGNSSVAVSVKDTARINQIETDISNLQKEIRQQEIKRTSIWKTERTKISDVRSEADKAIISNVKEAEKSYNQVKFESELYKNELTANDQYMDEIREKAFVNNYSPIKIILCATLISIPFIAFLSWVWIDTIKMVKLYSSCKRGL